ncbi:sodium/hydrogen exchanger [Microthyrium microscopicum]|uniref:Sodium/hydrogen exchanger n=1 Tax=Microthyrium microscopicum TaxID=703497 RepID=A0A6A6U311_9PEZI|nr:sodium/hydrogen exchanger [Microthyrium microscopicum]
MVAGLAIAALQLMKRASEADPDQTKTPADQEISTSWSLFILILLLISALFASYILQTRRIQAVHETVMSIFAGMVIGLILRLAASGDVLSNVSFNYQMFFNLLLPPIILASGYELHQANFFRNIGAILTFAFAGTFISAVVLGLILFVWTRMNLDGVDIDFIDAMSVGATLSATDPVTILAIFNAYQVDPKLYTVIFGEAILNDAIAIVLFETAQKYKEDGKGLKVFSLVESIGTFLFVFFGSLVIGLMIGMITSLMLKFTYLRRFPKTESCIIILIAYASYFFSNAISMSGIVSLLFCGICMKHYAYLNMSRRTQLTTKFVFQVMSQLSENFIFIYLGLSLFTERRLVFKPLFILITIIGICVARWCAIFPLSRMINWFIRYRARRNNVEAEELPYAHQVMLFWAGLRGAVGVALAAGLTGGNGSVLRATVLVVVVLTVIIFGGTTARMLEILHIRTGVVEEIDSDDEFDIEYITHGGSAGTFKKSSGSAFGHMPRGNGVALGDLDSPHRESSRDRNGTYSSGHTNGASNTGFSRRDLNGSDPAAEQSLLFSPDASNSASNADDTDDAADLDLPPAARRMGMRTPTTAAGSPSPYPTSGARPTRAASESYVSGSSRIANATGAISQLISELSEDPAGAFRHIDEDFIKPTLLLDPNSGGGGHGGGV